MGPTVGRWCLLHGVVNDAVAVYLRDAALAAAFVARWCAVDRVEDADGRSGFVKVPRVPAARRHSNPVGDHAPPLRGQDVLVCRSRETTVSARPDRWSCRRWMVEPCL